MATGKRYIPPMSRRKETTGAAAESRRKLDDLVQDPIFTVKLGSKNHYSDLPFPEVTEKDESNSNIQQFQFPFKERELRKLMLWFREIGWKDQSAELQFPPDLEKLHRKQVHDIAQSFGLGTSSKGFNEKRFISVYSIENATLGVGKNYLTKEEKEKANTIWRLVKQQGEEEKYKNFSHNEIDEMVLANSLDPLLKELWEKRESLLVDDFQEKSKVTDE